MNVKLPTVSIVKKGLREVEIQFFLGYGGASAFLPPPLPPTHCCATNIGTVPVMHSYTQTITKCDVSALLRMIIEVLDSL